jgi:undecaprenyl-diphosphatase
MEYVQAADDGGLLWFSNHHSTFGNSLMEFFTHLGDARTAVSVVILAVILFFLAGRRRTATILLLVSLLGLGISQSLKYGVKRERPEVAWKLIERPHSPSFPSGHSLTSMTIYGSLALLTSRSLRRRAAQTSILVAGFTLPLMIGISRPYLGVHYPSDVLAGWTMGLGCVLIALFADQRWGDRERFVPRRVIDVEPHPQDRLGPPLPRTPVGVNPSAQRAADD